MVMTEDTSDDTAVWSAFEGAPYGVAFLDTALRTRWANRRFSALVAAPESAGGSFPLTVLQSIEGEPLSRIALAVLGGTEPRNTFRANGGIDALSPALSATFHLVRNADGAAAGLCCLLTDLTDESRLVDALWQTQKLEAAGHLANIFAHDFNNLVAVIQGYCDLLLMKVTDDVVRDRVVKIRDAALSAAGLSRQLLLLTRPGDGRILALDLNLSLRAMKAAIEHALPSNIRRTVDLEESLPLALANASQLDQIVMTLVSNACDAMPDGGSLDVSTSSQSLADADAAALELSPGEYVRLTIRDTGSGMTSEVLGRLFEPGFTTKALAGGAGLGLATIRTMMRRLRGDVSVAAETPTGTSVSVWFPRAPTESVGDAHSRQDVSSGPP
jgi:signal transduction histidine kinase